MNDIRIFISYSHGDGIMAQKFVDLFERFDIDYFIDKKIPTGEAILRSIEQNLEQATHFILLLSENSIKSGWVHQESETAENMLPLKDANLRKFFPIIIQKGISDFLAFTEGVKRFEIVEHDITVDDLARILLKEGLFDDGIVPRKLFRWSESRLPKEVFAAELLTEPIFLKKMKNGQIQVGINRENVKNVVISNKGKKILCNRHIAPKRKEMIELDREIHRFMIGRAGQSMTVHTSSLPLRWGSGGALSIVRRGGRAWVPLFFRDIDPVGWNVSLGSTERFFEDDDTPRNDDLYSLKRELNDPWKFICREFLEETLILDREPDPMANIDWRIFRFDPMLDTKESVRQAEFFAREHLMLRRNKDGLMISPAREGTKIEILTCANSNIIIGGGSRASSSGSGELWDAIVAISPLEIGIEVVKIFKYDLHDDDYMLDGEIRLKKKVRELVRMPFALLSLDYMHRNFGAPDYEFEYTDDDVQPSIICEDTFSKEDIHVFAWDVYKRKEVLGLPDATESEKERCSNWMKEFADDFHAGLAGDPSRFPCKFTPATIKILNLFFNCCPKWRELSEG